MSWLGFVTDNYTLALTLAGTAGFEAERIVQSDLSLMSDANSALDENGNARPVLVVYPGSGRYQRSSFPNQGVDDEPGLWSAVWHLYFPRDDQANWITRWRALLQAVIDKLTAPGALNADTRGPIEVRWGEEPPLHLVGTMAPVGPEMFFTVTAEEY